MNQQAYDQRSGEERIYRTYPDGSRETVKRTVNPVLQQMPTRPKGQEILAPMVYEPYTRRAPRSYAHQMSRNMIDLTKLLIAFCIFIGTGVALMMAAERYVHISGNWVLGIIAVVMVIVVWNDD